MTRIHLRGARMLVTAGIFAAGFAAGSIMQRPAQAQLGDLGGKVMEKAGQGGGMMGSVAKLGTSIVDMQKEVDGLQKNLATLKEIRAALGG
jgi:hypothetical protein